MRDDPLIQLIIVIAPLSLLGDRRRLGDLRAAPAADRRRPSMAHGREFIELFAIARVTPGPGSMITTLIGWKVAGWLGALVATLALYIPCSVLCFAAARTWNRYRGTKWHTAIENGLRPIGAGLMIAGGVAMLRIENSGWLAWIVAFIVLAIMTWRTMVHPMLLLAVGAGMFLAVGAITG